MTPEEEIYISGPERIFKMTPEEEICISGPEPSFTVENKSLAEYLWTKIRALPQDQITHINADTGEELTVGEMISFSLEIGQRLKNLNMKQGDVVALIGENGHRIHAAALGTVWQGGVFAPLDPRLKVYELLHMFRLYNPKFVFCDACSSNEVIKAVHQYEHAVTIISLNPRGTLENGILKFEDILEEVQVNHYRPIGVNDPANELAVILCSSGSTGLPKGCGLTHSNIIYQLHSLEESTRNLPNVTSDDKYLQASHFVWVTAVGALLLSCCNGLKRVFMAKISAENILRVIHRYKPSWALLPPVEILAMLNHPDFKSYDVSSMKFVIGAGAAISPTLYRRFKTDWSPKSILYQTYGLTEFFGALTTFTFDTNSSSVGKLMPGVRMKIKDENGKSLGPNQLGQLCFTSPSLMKSYVGNEEVTQEVIDENRWYTTGDMGYYDESELIYIVDRKMEIIKFRNHQISPAEIENLIMTIPTVKRVGVVGIPDEKDSYHPMAFVVKEDGSKLTEKEIINYVRDNLSEYKQLRKGVKFVRELPLTPTQKIKRNLLKEMAMKLASEGENASDL